MELIIAGICIIPVLLGVGIYLVMRPDKKTQEQPAAAPPQQSAPAKPGLWVALIFAIIILLWLTGAFKGLGGSETKITYRVSGSARAGSVTYYNAQGGMEQRDVGFPFQLEFMLANGKPVSLVAQNKGASGSITCEIFKDGQSWKQSTTTAGYGVVTCAGWTGIE